MTQKNPPPPSDVTSPSTPPLAPRRAHRWARPTGDVDDPYAWMLDVDDPAFLDYLADENRFSTTWFNAHDATVDAIG